MSKHEVRVVRLGRIEKHGNADTLGITEVLGYPVVVRLADWKEGDLAAYIEPDYVVPDTPQFAFLQGNRRIKTRRFRGVMSAGLLIAAPPGAKEGDDVMSLLGIQRYEPPLEMRMGDDDIPGPSLRAPTYDLEPLQKHKDELPLGTPVLVTEKIHGTNARFVFHDGRMWCGSRTAWKKENFETNPWWQSLPKNPWIEEWCRAHPDFVLYGELFGPLQDLRYGAGKNDRLVVIFDVLRADGTIVSSEHPDHRGEIAARPPVVLGSPERVPFSAEVLAAADGPSLWPKAGHVREGVVVEVVEPYDVRLGLEGRRKWKLVSNDYLSR